LNIGAKLDYLKQKWYLVVSLWRNMNAYIMI
jgi:hypothetical protein